jgi:hypothetical protein
MSSARSLPDNMTPSRWFSKMRETVTGNSKPVAFQDESRKLGTTGWQIAEERPSTRPQLQKFYPRKKAAPVRTGNVALSQPPEKD